jgi:hypothetical protein
VIEAAEVITRQQDEGYEVFVARSARNALDLVIENADVADNADENRLTLLAP